jgi:hypothetical protein
MKKRFLALCASLVLVPCGLAISSTGAFAQSSLSARTPIRLSPLEREFLQTEMHLNLRALQAVYAALAQQDHARAAESAATRGMATFGDKDPTRPKTLTAKLPQAWRALSGAGRQGFDELASALAARESDAQIFGRLAKLHDNCNACHATFRLEDQP